MAALRESRVGTTIGPGGGGGAAPRRSTMATTAPATRAVTMVAATARRATGRRRRGSAGAASGAGKRPVAGSPTQTPNGGRRSVTPSAGDHNPDMNLPRPGHAAQVAGIVERGPETAHRETYIVQPGDGRRPTTRPPDGPDRPALQVRAGPGPTPGAPGDHGSGRRRPGSGKVTNRSRRGRADRAPG